MKKKVLIIAGVVLVLIGGLFLVLRSRKRPSVVSPVGEPEKPEVKLDTWEDQAGFSFSYPEEIEIDPHEEDTENYAHLELTSANHSGKILIWCQDTDHLDIDAWAEDEATEGAQFFDSELGGEPAKKVAYSEPEKLVMATIDIDALVLIEMTPDEEDYWQGAYDSIVSSFTFIPLEGEEAVAPGPWEGGGGAGGIIEEPEEVIE